MQGLGCNLSLFGKKRFGVEKSCLDNGTSESYFSELFCFPKNPPGIFHGFLHSFNLVKKSGDLVSRCTSYLIR